MKSDTIIKHVGAAVLLISLLFVGGKFRLQGTANIPIDHFASNDAFLYYSQAKTIVAEGALPDVDDRRWVPTGRDLSSTFNGYSYVLAYAYKFIILFLPGVTLYQVLLFAPTVCFLIGVAVLCAFLYVRFGISVAAIVGILLIIMPGSIDRSTAGFSDRDAWCWMLATLAVTIYLWKENITRAYPRYICAGLSGVCVFVGGLSWEGFGGFVLVIVVVELWRFLTTETEENLSEYLLWVLMFVPTLYGLSPVYRSGSSWTTHVTAFLLLPSLVLLAGRTLRYFLMHKKHAVSKVITEQISARAISLVCIAICILIGIAYIAFQRDTFATSILPLSAAEIMEMVEELQTPHDSFWYGRYGHVLLIASLCLSIGCIRIWGKKAIPLAALLAFFTTATFLRQYLYHVLSPVLCEYLFYGAVAFTPIAALGIAVLRTEEVTHELTYVAFAFWLLLWVGLARDALRYDFFIGVPLSFFAALGIQHCSILITKYIHQRTPRKMFDRIHTMTKPAVTLAAIALLLFFELPGNNMPALAQRGYQTRISPEAVFPGKNTPFANACHWIQEHLSEDSVIAAPWSYGHMLNVLGGVKTVVDPDHFILHRIQLYEKHVSNATTEREALEFLKTHNVTHLLLTEEDVLHTAANNRQDADKLSAAPNMMPLIPRVQIGTPHYRMRPAFKNSAINFVEIDFHHTPADATAHLKNGKTVQLGYVIADGNPQTSHVEEDHEHNTAQENGEERTQKNGGILHFFNQKTHQEAIHYLSPQRWNSLAIKLFFRNQHSDAFGQLYPQKQTADAKFKIWEIHYPPDIKENTKDLEKSPQNKDQQK